MPPTRQEKSNYDAERRVERVRNCLCTSCGAPNLTRYQNCEYCRELFRLRNIPRREAYRRKAFDHYGRECQCCGETTERFLQFDHINNDGHARRQADKGETALSIWLVVHGFPDDFQVLCANCNFAKRFGTCPHQEGL